MIHHQFEWFSLLVGQEQRHLVVQSSDNEALVCETLYIQSSM